MKKEKFAVGVLERALTLVGENIGSTTMVIPFFGTLLGLTREGHPIEADDDLDFFVDQIDFAELLSQLRKSEVFEILFVSKTTDFAVALTKDADRVPIAFHGYERIKGHLLDRWNWSGIPEVGFLALRVPDSLVFPVSSWKRSGLAFPAHPQALCRFLYGKSWEVPKTKFKDYKTLALFGRPISVHGAVARLSHAAIRAIKRVIRFRPNIEGPSSSQT